MTVGLPPKRAGIIDVAKMAGVSRQTVTRAVNDMAGISSETKARVLAAAKELGYRPSRFGRGLVTKGTPSLGLIITDLTNPYFAYLASSVAKLATEHGWALLLMENPPNIVGGTERLREFSLQVDAVIGYLGMSAEVIEDTFRDMPVVSLDDESPHAWRASVEIDFDPGMRAVLAHLRSSNRHRIVMVDRPINGGSSARARSYERESTAIGIKAEILSLEADGLAEMEMGRIIADQLVVRGEIPDALICYNDAVAIGLLKQFQIAGIAVPEKCAIVGIDGLAIGTLVTPELTTLSLDVSEVADRAVEMILDMVERGHLMRADDLRSVVSNTLVLRGSG
ncbi:MAG TPA: LacI family DNA-binding transcriptional regulator [Acidothermaceae bacterium]|nr:LacI family DNA-binding transcriptional regulator [Acidothermaceae bacterium]